MANLTWERKAELLFEMLDAQKGELCAEPRLNGAPWPDMDNLPSDKIRSVSFYTHDVALARQMVANGYTQGDPLIQESEDDTICKLRLDDKLITACREAGRELPLGNPMGEGRLFSLLFPQNVRVALAQSAPHYHTGYNDVLLLRSRDPDNVLALQNMLEKQGLISKKPPRSGYRLQSVDDGMGFVAAVSIPPELAQAIRFTRSNDCEEFFDYLPEGKHKHQLAEGGLNFDTLVGLASSYLSPIERIENKSVPRSKPVVAAPSEKPALKSPEDFIPALTEEVIAFQSERRIDGRKTHYLHTQGKNSALFEQLRSPDVLAEPFNLRVLNHGSTGNIYELIGEDYPRLKSLLPPQAVKTLPEEPCYIPESLLSDKYVHTLKRNSHLSEFYFVVAQNGKGHKRRDDHYLYVTADTPERLNFFLNGLPAKNEALSPQLVTHSSERPCILRLSLSPEAAQDLATQPFAARVRNQINIRDLRRGSAATTKSLDGRVRQMAGVQRIYSNAGVAPHASVSPDAESPVAEVTQIPKMTYAEQQTAEAEMVTLVSDLVERQQTRQEPVRVAFVNTHRQKTRRQMHGGKEQKQVFEWVEPKLYLSLTEANLDTLRVNPAVQLLGSLEEAERSSNGRRLVAVSGSAEMMEALHLALPNIPTVTSSGPVYSGSEDTLEAAVILPKIRSHFTSVEKDHAEFQRTISLGFSADEVAQYRSYSLWKANPRNNPKPSDGNIERIETKLKQIEDKQARTRAYNELASRDLLLVDVQHLTDSDITKIEHKMEQLSTLNQSIRHTTHLLDEMKGLIGKLNSSHEAGAIHGMQASLEALQSHIRTLEESRNRISEHIDDVSSEVASYKGWAEKLGNQRTAKHVLVLKVNEQTREVLDAIDDDSHMTRSPLLLAGAGEKGSDIMMLFPTESMVGTLVEHVRGREEARLTNKLRSNGESVEPDRFRSTIDRRVAEHFPRLAPQPVEPGDIPALLRKRYQIDEESVSKPAPAVNPFTGVINRLRQPMESAKPQLVAQREEHAFQNHSAQSRIGEQYALLFTVRHKRDLRPLKEIQSILQEAGQLCPPSHYGELVDATYELNKEQQRIQSLQGNLEKLEDLYHYYQENLSAVKRLEMHDNNDGGRADFQLSYLKRQEASLSQRNAELNTLIEAFEGLGVYAAVRRYPQASQETDYLTSPPQLISTLKQPVYGELMQSLAKLRGQVRGELEQYEYDAVDTVSQMKDAQVVSVKQHSTALFDSANQPVNDMTLAEQLSGHGEARMYKLFITPEAKDAVFGLFQQHRGRFNSGATDGIRAQTAEQITEQWAARQAKGEGAGR